MSEAVVTEEARQDELAEALTSFAAEHSIRSKGALCLPLVVTDHAKVMGLPLDPNKLRTDKEGQVLGLGKGKVQQILARHGIERVLAEEGGRTSRGSLGKMSAYVAFLNGLHVKTGGVDLEAVEAFWIARVREFFAAKPFTLRLDPTLSVRAAFRLLFAQAEARQKEMSGTMIVGTIMQHLVGAKLEGAFGSRLVHHSASTKDEGQSRPGDFDLGDLAFHVSTAPGEALIRKCQSNLAAGQRPVIVTAGRGVGLAAGLAENAAIADRLDVFDVEQWLAADILERGGDSAAGRLAALEALLDRYNRIVATVETDPSLRIELAASGRA
ncbi:MAG: DUF4928 family protein [Pseudomonadota bacterium]|jgi:hypothetical protein|uniref:DUF4928 family protein n=1 Tax=Phenylobacterium sp. TaxID=1871053 RepID=UPI001A3627F2|nr:DUF4928 family protein [Phenylobacterium sp.]MBJ7410245.1 DUF4928 family protein [Phenylobacterium sp.]